MAQEAGRRKREPPAARLFTHVTRRKPSRCVRLRNGFHEIEALPVKTRVFLGPLLVSIGVVLVAVGCGTSDESGGGAGTVCTDNCDCPMGTGCDFDCRDCQVDCVNASCTGNCTSGNCELDCDEGGMCTYRCTGGDCTFDCDANSTCNITCGMGACEVGCDAGSTCTVNCPAGSTCDVQCSGGMATCSGAGNCDVASDC